MDEIKGTYLGAAIPGASFYVNEDSWESSLFHNLLFQPEVHIHDAGLLGGEYVRSHLQRHKPCWLEHALEVGRLVPQIREEKELHQVSAELRGSGFTGQPSDDKDADYVLARLNKLSIKREVVWPKKEKSVGEFYQEALGSLLRAETCPPDLPVDACTTRRVLAKAWNDPDDFKVWRETWPVEAAEKTRLSGNTGLRYTDLIEVAIERFLGSRERPETTVEGLLSLVEKGSRSHKRLTAFFKLACECHSMSFARQIGCRCSSVNADRATAPIILGLAATSEHSMKEDLHRLGSLRLPPLDELRRTNGEVLRSIWDSDPAGRYKTALEKWRKDEEERRNQPLASRKPTDESLLGNVATEMEAYAQEIRRKVSSSYREKGAGDENVIAAVSVGALLALLNSGIKLTYLEGAPDWSIAASSGLVLAAPVLAVLSSAAFQKLLEQRLTTYAAITTGDVCEHITYEVDPIGRHQSQ